MENKSVEKLFAVNLSEKITDVYCIISFNNTNHVTGSQIGCQNFMWAKYNTLKFKKIDNRKEIMLNDKAHKF